MNKHIIVSLLVLSFSGVAVAGNYDISQDGNTRNGTLQQGRVEIAEVIDVREVKIEPTYTAQIAGTGIGATAGAVIGNQVVKGGFLGGALGGMIGGVVGNVAAEKITQATAQELILKKEDGKLITITQADSELVSGDKVYIVESAGKLRVRKQ